MTVRGGSFTVQQGNKEWQQWVEIPVEKAAEYLSQVIFAVNSHEPIVYFTTTSTIDPNVNVCRNQVNAIPAPQAILELVKIVQNWKEGAQNA